MSSSTYFAEFLSDGISNFQSTSKSGRVKTEIHLGQWAVTQTFQAKIYVTLRPSVLDPAGTAVQSGLSHLGHGNVGSVRIGKYIELTVTATDADAAATQVDRMCDQLLANPVIEIYRFEVQAVTPSGAPT